MSQVIDLLKELIKIDSINPFTIEKNNAEWILGDNTTDICSFLEKKLTDYGFSTEKQFVHTNKNGQKFYNLLGTKGSGDKSILFYAHMDTVTAKPWLSKEIALTPVVKKMNIWNKERNILVALGSNDMKAGIACILEATKDINPKDYQIKVAFGTDEEFYSLGGNILAQSSFLDSVKAIMVPEIGDGPNVFYGPGTIGLGRLGRCEYEINLFGTGGHGAISFTPEFINAATEAAVIVTELEKIRLKHDDQCIFFNSKVPDKTAINKTSGSFFVSKIDCGDGSLSIPSKGKIIIDCTFSPNFTPEYFGKMLNNLLDKLYSEKKLHPVTISGKIKKAIVKPRLRPTPFSKAFLTSENNDFTKYVKNCIENIVEFKNYNMGYSVADENVFQTYRPQIPTLVLGPVGFDSHKADEWVDIDSVDDLTKTYKEIAENFTNFLKTQK